MRWLADLACAVTRIYDAQFLNALSKTQAEPTEYFNTDLISIEDTLQPTRRRRLVAAERQHQ